MYEGVTQANGSRLAYGEDPQLVQLADIVAERLKAAQEIVDAIGAREDYPVVAVQVLYRLIQLGVTLRLNNLNGRANDSARAQTLKLAGKRGSLCACARKDDGKPI